MNLGEPVRSPKWSMMDEPSKVNQKAHRQSDQSIVPEKPSNVGGGKGLAGMRMKSRDTSAAHGGG